MLKNKKIDFELLAGIILIEAEADGKNGLFAFDTGSTRTVINSAHYAPSGGEEAEASVYAGSVQSRNITEGNVQRFSVADIMEKEYPVYFLDLSYVEESLRAVRSDLTLLGTIGMDFISRYRVRIDYANQNIVLNPEPEFEKCCCVNFELNHSMIVVSGSIGDEKCNFLLDTGANTCLLDEALCHNKSVQESGQGMPPFLITELHIGQKAFCNIAAASGKVKDIKKVPIDAIIGYQILSQQRADIDFAEKKLLLELK